MSTIKAFLIPLLLLPALAGAAPSPAKPSELRDLHYGEALYQLYQLHYFDAIVRLLTAQKQGRMQAYDAEPDLLLGGLYLAYGMADKAESIFHQVLRDSASPQVHDRAWLQLAKSRHRREQAVSATAALSQIGSALSEGSTQERQVLQGLIALNQGQSEGALQALQEITGKSEWSAYGRYNRAIALVRSREPTAGLQILRELGTAKAATEEMKALRDRANLVRGYLLLEQDKPAEAKAALEQIRLSGLATNQALLGVGWAALQLDDPQGALAPWQELARRDARDPAVLEVMLAIPYALSLLQADAQSLEAYRQGIQRYDQELARLDRAIDSIGRNQLLAALTQTDAQSAPNDIIGLLPLLLSENRFQEHLQDYRDLAFLQQNLQQWSDKISSYRAMLAVRKDAYQAKLPRVEAGLSDQALGELEAAREQLQQRFDSARTPQEPAFILASAEEQRLLERFTRIEELFTQIGERQEMPEQHEHTRLLRGLLVWRTVTQHPARIWEAKKQLRSLDHALQLTRDQQAALRLAHANTQGQFLGFAQRIDQLERRIPDLLAQVTRTKDAQARLLRQMAAKSLHQRKSLINNYLIQARFGVASLLDRNSQPGGDAE